jgi:hypothetical protein
MKAKFVCICAVVLLSMLLDNVRKLLKLNCQCVVELATQVLLQSTSVDQVTWVIHEGGFLFIIYHNCQKSSPIR